MCLLSSGLQHRSIVQRTQYHYVWCHSESAVICNSWSRKFLLPLSCSNIEHFIRLAFQNWHLHCTGMSVLHASSMFVKSSTDTSWNAFHYCDGHAYSTQSLIQKYSPYLHTQWEHTHEQHHCDSILSAKYAYYTMCMCMHVLYYSVFVWFWSSFALQGRRLLSRNVPFVQTIALSCSSGHIHIWLCIQMCRYF